MSERQARWTQYLDDLQSFAGTNVPIESQGKLVRVAGLVLEATGIKVPVGSVCEIHMPSSGKTPRRAHEVVRERRFPAGGRATAAGTRSLSLYPLPHDE